MASDEVPKRIYLTWRDVEECASSIAHQLVRGECLPQHILSIARGGLIPAALVGYHYTLVGQTCPSHSSVLVQSYDAADQRGRLKLGFMSGPTVTRFLQMGSMLLIVDDLTDSGETMKVMQEMFPEAQTAVLLHKKTSNFRPTYIGREAGLNSHKWYVFPWERRIVRRK